MFGVDKTEIKIKLLLFANQPNFDRVRNYNSSPTKNSVREPLKTRYITNDLAVTIEITKNYIE